jgi:hypothetical protein
MRRNGGTVDGLNWHIQRADIRTNPVFYSRITYRRNWKEYWSGNKYLISVT